MPRATETQHQATLIAHAELLGWHIQHTAKSRKNLRSHASAGYPDLTMVRNGRLIFAELKVPPNTSTPAQVAWQEALSNTGSEVYVWNMPATGQPSRESSHDHHPILARSSHDQHPGLA